MEYGQTISLFESEGSGLIWDGTGGAVARRSCSEALFVAQAYVHQTQIIIGAEEASGPGIPPQHTPPVQSECINT